MRSEPEQDQGVEEEPTEEQLQEDLFGELRREVPEFGDYDELALEQYRALSFYFHQRARLKAPRAVAAKATCELFGHDAPRGLCRRCGLGVDLTKTGEDQDRKRVADRAAFLASRH